VADERDRDLLVGWSRAFLREVGDQAEDPAAEVDGRLGYRPVEDRTQLSFATAGSPEPGGALGWRGERT
jgi:hypothetical protein